jgi:hypothetical protein
VISQRYFCPHRDHNLPTVTDISVISSDHIDAG